MVSGTHSEYQYVPLNKARGQQTRLLCLAAGSDDDEIFAKLWPFSLRDPELPRFTALSYTWVSRSKDTTIHVDSTTLPVTSNLHAALKHLRKGHEQCWVWVDAICIHQADNAEKSFQVPNMHLVYRAATYCLAWLGPPGENSELGMRKIRDLDHFLDHPGPLDVAIFSSPAWKAILHVLDRDFFKRIWIVQELSWAKDVYLTCGGIGVHLNQFTKAKDYIALYRTRVQGGFGAFTLSLITELRARLPGTRAISGNVQDPLLRVLTSKVGLKATDPRDHIYATLNLIPNSAWPSSPDYSKDVVQVFAEATAEIMKTTRSLGVLRLCDASRLVVPLPPDVDSCIPQLLKTEKAGQRYAMLPSWVPNWSKIVTRPSQNEFGALLGSRSSIYACDVGIPPRTQIRGSRDLPLLWTHAILFDSIQTSYALQVRSMYDGDAWEQLALDAFGANDRNSEYQNGDCSLEEAFWRTLMIDCIGSDTCSRAAPTDISDLMERAKGGFHVTDREFADLQERCFFVTKTGMFGIGPMLSQVGDLIAILPGCSVTMVLRESPKIGLYQIIGESCKSLIVLLTY